MKRIASPGSMHDTGCLGLVHWDDPEGWYGEGGGRRVQDGVTVDEMVGWCHQLNGHEFEQTQGDSEGQGSLVCYSPWGSQRVGLSN